MNEGIESKRSQHELHVRKFIITAKQGPLQTCLLHNNNAFARTCFASHVTSFMQRSMP